MSKENLVKEIIRTKLSEAGMSSKFRKAVEEYKEVSLKLQDLYADRAKALEGYKKADGAEKEKYKAELSRIQKLVSPLQAQMEKAERVFNKALLSEPEDLEEGKAMDMSEDETLGVAETLAKAISKIDGVKCTVDMKTIEPAHFDLVMVVNGKKEEAGTFNIHSDGSVRNEAIGGVKYGTVDSSVSDFIRNLKRMSETVEGNNVNMNEAKITSIPNLNLESDSYIAMYDMLKSNSKFKSIVAKGIIDYATGGRPEHIVNKLSNDLVRSVVTDKFIIAVASEVNKKSPRLSVSPQQAKDTAVRLQFSKILSAGLIFDFNENMRDTAKMTGDSEAIEAASEFSVNRGKAKLKTMMGNKFGESVDKDGMERVAAGLPQTEEEPVTEAKFNHINTGEKTINKKVMNKVKETFPTMKSVKKKNVPNMGEVLYIHDGDGNAVGHVYVDKQHGAVIDVKEGVSEALNPAAGEWVLYRPIGSFKMKFVSLHKSHRSAQMAMRKAVGKMYKDDVEGGYGIMSKDMWDKEDSRFKVESVSEGKNDKKIKELEAKLARIKGKTPADEGWRAAIRDDIERLKFEKKFGSKYDIGLGSYGNGVTVWNRLETQDGDYKTIAHISHTGKVSFRDKSLPDNVKKYIEDYAKKGMNEMVNEVRVTHGKEELHKLNGMSKKQFADKYKGDGVDIFFKDDDTAVVSNRTSNLVHHGKDGGKTAKLDGVSAVYGGLEGKFYTPENWKKVLHSVYKGKQVNVGTLNMKDEAKSVNEASRRANEFFGDSKHGQEIHKMLKGKWDAKKVDNYLEELGGGRMQMHLRIIDFITKAAGLNPRKYDTQTLGKQISDLINKLEVLYKDFTGGTEVKKFDDVHIKSKNITGMVYAISGNNLVVRTPKGLVKATKDDVEVVMSDGVMKEGNAFGMAVTQAKKDGKKEFEFNGKTYKVKKGSIEENEKETISESDCGCGANITEAVKEPEVITKLRDIVNRRGYATIKDPVTKKNVKVDTFSASAIIQVYDAVNDTNKQKLAALSIPKMAGVAFKLAK